MTGKSSKANNTKPPDFKKVPGKSLKVPGKLLAKAIAGLKKELDAERKSQQRRRFIFIFITFVLLDMVLYSILGAWTVPGILAIFQLMALIFLAPQRWFIFIFTFVFLDMVLYPILGAWTVPGILAILLLVALILLALQKLKKIKACWNTLSKKDQDIAEPEYIAKIQVDLLDLQIELYAKRESRQPEWFIFIVIVIILLDVLFFSALDVWTGSLMLTILELLVLIVLGRRMEVIVVEEILDRFLTAVSRRK